MKDNLHLNLHLKKTGRKRRRRGRLSAEGFTLFRRRGGRTWYFYAKEGSRRVARSTGKTDKAEAEAVARKYLRPNSPATTKTVGDFVKDFFVWGKCPWIAAQHAAGRSFSAGAAIGRRSHVATWILPKFKDRLISSITPRELRDWIISLPLSGQSKNHLKYTLKIIFSEAVFAGIIEHNPVDGIRNVALNRKERDALSLEDLAKLFPKENQELFRVWGDAGIAVLFLTLAATGVRSGEIRALQWKHLAVQEVALAGGPKVEVPFLLIEQGVKFFSGEIGSTKSGKGRPVYLPERARAALEWWRENSYGETGPNDLVFPGSDGKKPINEPVLRGRFKKALTLAGVEVGGRNLVPHSFRHAYVTRSKKALPADLLLLMAGHADERVQRGYLHPTVEEHLKDMAAARLLIEGAAQW